MGSSQLCDESSRAGGRTGIKQHQERARAGACLSFQNFGIIYHSHFRSAWPMKTKQHFSRIYRGASLHDSHGDSLRGGTRILAAFCVSIILVFRQRTACTKRYISTAHPFCFFFSPSYLYNNNLLVLLTGLACLRRRCRGPRETMHFTVAITALMAVLLTVWMINREARYVVVGNRACWTTLICWR